MLRSRSFEHGYIAAIAVCMIGAASSVRAADSGPFVAFDLGGARYPQNYEIVSSEAMVSSATVLTNSTLNRDRFEWSISGGYRFNRYVSVEASYVDLGSIAGPLTLYSGPPLAAEPQLRFSAKGETLAAVGMLPLGRWDLFLKGGVFFADTRLQAVHDTSYQTQHALVGFGLDRHFAENWSTQIGLTDYLSVGQTSQIRGPTIKVLNAGVTYAF